MIVASLSVVGWVLMLLGSVAPGLDQTERATYDIPEIAAKLGISTNHAYALARERAFPVIRLGRRLVVPRDRFDSWLRGED